MKKLVIIAGLVLSVNDFVQAASIDLIDKVKCATLQQPGYTEPVNIDNLIKNLSANPYNNKWFLLSGCNCGRTMIQTDTELALGQLVTVSSLVDPTLKQLSKFDRESSRVIGSCQDKKITVLNHIQVKSCTDPYKGGYIFFDEIHLPASKSAKSYAIGDEFILRTGERCHVVAQVVNNSLLSMPANSSTALVPYNNGLDHRSRPYGLHKGVSPFSLRRIIKPHFA